MGTNNSKAKAYGNRNSLEDEKLPGSTAFSLRRLNRQHRSAKPVYRLYFTKACINPVARGRSIRRLIAQRALYCRDDNGGPRT
jgi:hypothetical protein